MKKTKSKTRTRTFVAAYVRISTGEQSTRSQRHTIREFAKANHIRTDEIKWFEDRMSGTRADRPALARMLRAVDAGKVSTVLVVRLGRLSRRTRDGLRILQQLSEQQVRVVAIAQNLDFSGAMGQFLATLFLALAEFERETTVSRVREGLASAVARGIRLGRPPNQKRRQQVRRLRDQGLTVIEISKKLKTTRQNVYSLLSKTEAA